MQGGPPLYTSYAQSIPSTDHKKCWNAWESYLDQFRTQRTHVLETDQGRNLRGYLETCPLLVASDASATVFVKKWGISLRHGLSLRHTERFVTTMTEGRGNILTLFLLTKIFVSAESDVGVQGHALLLRAHYSEHLTFEQRIASKCVGSEFDGRII